MIFEKYYIFISILLVSGALVLVFRRLDRRNTGVRRLTLIAVMTSLSIVSRFVFAAFPAFKPMTSIVILTGVYLGPEAGLLCGCLTAFLSNFYFGQGPWTPFQMVALGLIGAVAALLFCGERRLPHPKLRLFFLCLYGLVSGVFYSFFLDTWTMLWTYGTITRGGYLAVLAAAVPYTILYSVSNIIFLLLLDIPFGKRLGRLISKYRI